MSSGTPPIAEMNPRSEVPAIGQPSKTMHAIVQDRYGSAEVLELRQVERPEVGERDVLVRVRATSVAAGVWHLMTGQPYLVRLGLGLRKPRNPIPGLDIAGRVEAVGAGVTRFRPGDEVFGVGRGAFSEYALAREDQLVSKPAGVTFEQAASAPTSAITALLALRVGKVRAGQRVLVIGASGGVGTFAVQIARALGAEVTGVCSTSKVDLVRSIGADHVIDYTRQDITDGEERYDVILDIAGNRALSHLRRALTPTGTLVITGGEGGGKWFGGIDRQLRAVALSPFVRQTMRFFITRVSHADLAFLAGLLETGAVIPAVERTYRLDEAREAMRHFESGRTRGKLVITA